MSEPEDRLVVTMTRGAAHNAWRALVWAAGEAEDANKDEHYDWLSWLAGRIAGAQKVEEDGPS